MEVALFDIEYPYGITIDSVDSFIICSFSIASIGLIGKMMCDVSYDRDGIITKINILMVWEITYCKKRLIKNRIKKSEDFYSFILDSDHLFAQFINDFLADLASEEVPVPKGDFLYLGGEYTLQ